MGQKIKVSVIVPVYNVKDYLGQCIQSVIEQTEENIEIILVNDGSTDGSGQVCKDFQLLDQRIVYIENENQGAARARNTGMSKANGEWLFFIDGDDYLPADALEKLLAFSENADIVAGNISYVENGRIVQNSVPAAPFSYESSAALIGSAFGCRRYIRDGYNVNICSACGKLYRRFFCEREGLRFPSTAFMEDGLFNITAVQKTKMNRIVFTNEQSYCYRQRNGSATHRYMPDIEITAKHIMKHMSCSLLGSDEKSIRDLMPCAKVSLLKSGVALSCLHKDCPYGWNGKAKKLEALSKACKIRENCRAEELGMLTEKQRILVRLLSAGHYRIALFLFYMNRRIRL